MPLQGLAQTVAALLCPPTMHHGQKGGDSHHHDSAAHSHSHAGDAALNASDDGAGASGHADHFCCNMVVSALPASFASFASPDYSILAATPGLIPYFTFLEFPQRPPLV
jgi:hypothetical protein